MVEFPAILRKVQKKPTTGNCEMYGMIDHVTYLSIEHRCHQYAAKKALPPTID